MKIIKSIKQWLKELCCSHKFRYVGTFIVREGHFRLHRCKLCGDEVKYTILENVNGFCNGFECNCGECEL